MGCDSFSDCCSSSTWISVCASFSRPFSSRSLLSVVPWRFWANSVTKVSKLARNPAGGHLGWGGGGGGAGGRFAEHWQKRSLD